MPERVTEAAAPIRQASFTQIGGLADESGHVQVEDKCYVIQRYTRKGEALVKINDVSITSEQASEGDIAGAPPTDATQVGGIATVNVPTHVEGTLNEISLDLAGNLRAILPTVTATYGADVAAQLLFLGQYSQSGVPVSSITGQAIRAWYDTLGRAIGFADDLGNQARRTVPVSAPPRSVLGPITFTQIDEPGVTVATNISKYTSWSFQIVVAGSPTALTIVAEGSHDNSNWFDLDTTSTAKTGLAIASNIGTISQAGVYEWKGGTFASKYIRLKVMPTSGSPESVTLDIQLMASN